MADVKQAFDFVMTHEDRHLKGEVVNDGPGAVARFGVNSHAHPKAVDDGFYAMDRERALEYAYDIFKYDYWAMICGYTIHDQRVANQFADLAFNCGDRESCRIVQRAVRKVGAKIEVDGEIGPFTLDAINIAEPTELLAEIKDYARQFYNDLAHREPKKHTVSDLGSWLARLDA